MALDKDEIIAQLEDIRDSAESAIGKIEDNDPQGAESDLQGPWPIQEVIGHINEAEDEGVFDGEDEDE